MKRNIRTWLIILSAIVIIFNIRGYFLLVNKLSTAERELEKSRALLGQEQKEKQLLQNELIIVKEQFQDVQANLENTQKKLKIVHNGFTSAKKSNLALQEEKAALKAKLRSLKELKKAMRQAQVEHYWQQVQEYLAKKKRQKEIDAQKLAEGNCGFLIKNSSPFYKPKVKIEVKPIY